jgi:hypothetical protein
MMPMTKRQMDALERSLLQERRNTRYVILNVDGETRTYSLTRVPARERRWWATHHWDLGPRYRHARWMMVRLNSPYKSDHYEWVNGRAVTYQNVGRTRGEVLRTVTMLLRKGGAKQIHITPYYSSHPLVLVLARSSGVIRAQIKSSSSNMSSSQFSLGGGD